MTSIPRHPHADRHPTRTGGRADERAEQLKERVYISFTALAVVLTLRAHPADNGANAVTLGVTVVGALLAMFLADILSHIAAHAAVPSRAEVRGMVGTSLGAFGAVFVPVVLVILADLGVMALDLALNLSLGALLVSLFVVGFLAIFRVPLSFWQRAGVLLAEGALAVAVIALQLLAHGG